MTAQLSLNFYPHAPAPGKRDTSRAACPSATEAHKVREDAYRLICQEPLTADEVADRLGVLPGYARPRCSELATAGRIEATGLRRKNKLGNGMNVWRKTQPSLLSGL